MTRIRVLIVDDSRAILGILVAALQDRGFECLTANDGRQALDVLQDNAVDLVLTDLWMDNLDGRGLIQEMKRHPELVNLPVVVLTTDTTPESRQGLIQAGALHVLNKPFSTQRLITAISRAVDVGCNGRSSVYIKSESS